MLVKFWGVHGSLPRPGPSTLKYGGNTACVEVRDGSTLIIFDAGTGIRELGDDLLTRHKSPAGEPDEIVGHIFFSHLHWDHVHGFPFFIPAYKKDNEFHLYGAGGLERTICQIMYDQMCPPNFPITPDSMAAAVTFHNLQPGDTFHIDDVVVRAESLNHPGGSFGYRVQSQGKTVTYATDTEYIQGSDQTALDLARDADVLIHDGMFTPEQYLGLWDNIRRESWGHSTWESAVQLAKIANVKQLVLFHHGNEDEMVAEIERKAQEKFPQTKAAYEGMEIKL